MNLKRIFGALLTLLGLAALIYTAITFTNGSSEGQDIKSMLVYGILGLVFLVQELA